MENAKNPQPYADFGKSLKEKRVKRGLSQQGLADLVGCSMKSIIRWENGETYPTPTLRPILDQVLKDTPPLEEIENLSPKPSNQESSPNLERSRRFFLKKGVIILPVVLLLGGGTYWVWRQKTSSPPLYTYQAPPNISIYDVEWSGQGNNLVCVNGNGQAQIIEVLPSAYRPTIQFSAYLSATWSPNGTQLATPERHQSYSVQVWDPVNGTSQANYTEEHPTQVINVAWSPDGIHIAASDDQGVVQIWDVVSTRPLFTYRKHSGKVWWVSWSSNSTQLASAGNDKTIFVWDARTGKTIFSCKGHTGPIVDVKWSPKDRQIVSASEDKTARIWDATTGNISYIYHGHDNSVQAAEWSPDGKMIATGSADTTVQVWDVATGMTLQIYTGHSKTVWAIAWSPDGKRIASASDDGSMQIWQVSTA